MDAMSLPHLSVGQYTEIQHCASYVCVFNWILCTAHGKKFSWQLMVTMDRVHSKCLVGITTHQISPRTS